jgi:GAF domain-containing protein
MAESLYIHSGTRAEQYESLLPQIKGLLEGETNLIANLANVASALHMQFGWLWIGFYLVDADQPDQLVLGPFQGPIACTRIAYGRGVCGSAWKDERTLIVPDVEQFPGHIACSSLSKSEIVVPLRDSTGKILGVLDIDSTELNTYDETDQRFLEALCAMIANAITGGRGNAL